MSPQPREETAEEGLSSEGASRVPDRQTRRILTPVRGCCVTSVIDAGIRSAGSSWACTSCKRSWKVRRCSRWNDLGRTYDEIEKLFDRLQRIYQSTSLTVVRSPLGQLFAERLPLWRCSLSELGPNDSFSIPPSRSPRRF